MKIGIVGCGFVGSSGAFAIALEGKANDLILVDLNADLAQGACRRYPACHAF